MVFMYRNDVSFFVTLVKFWVVFTKLVVELGVFSDWFYHEDGVHDFNFRSKEVVMYYDLGDGSLLSTLIGFCVL